MTESFPPQNYTPVPSTLAGIDVYAPAPTEQAAQPEEVEFKCPQCGATTAYSAADGGLTCSHCGYYEPPKKTAVGRRAQEFEFTLENLERAAHGWGEARKEIVCQSCGAVSSIAAEAIALTCAFCGSNKVTLRQASQDMLRPGFLVPFKVDENSCQNLTRQWLQSSWMTPPGLKNLSRMAGFTSVYLPYWTFDAVTAAAWKAEVGHTRTERYRQGREWRERTVVDWRWESGQVQLNIDDLIVEGTGKLSRVILDQLKGFDLGALTPYDPSFLAGFQARTYDLPLEKAWEIAREQMREETRQACLGQASTPRVRNFSMNLDFSQESWRYVLLPIYVAAYQYQGVTYQVMVNGQTGNVAGQRPVDWTKVWLVIAAVLSPGVLLSLLGLVTSFLGIGVAIGVFGFFLLLVGVVVAVVILRKAMSMDDV
jgi:Zn finger protein HypA/HybF involved in hydrogenase expression